MFTVHARRAGTRSRVVAALVVPLVVVLLAVPAGAHTEVQSAEPGVASEVTGPVDSVTLVFLSEIAPGASIELTAPSGPVDADGPATIADDARTVTRTFDPVDEPGDYVVRYAFAAADGDAQEESYRFRIVTADDSGPPIGAVAVAAAAVVVVVFALARRRRIPS